jgi:hypothetical protein
MNERNRRREQVYAQRDRRQSRKLRHTSLAGLLTTRFAPFFERNSTAC